MRNCEQCGIGTPNNNKIYCEKFKNMQELVDEKTTCIYFIEKQYEDDEVLPPVCHILLQEKILKSHKINCGHK